jgi:hypothetical protein
MSNQWRVERVPGRISGRKTARAPEKLNKINSARLKANCCIFSQRCDYIQ